jgi:hypothetical protein
MGQLYLSPTIYYDAVYLLPATYAKTSSPKHEYYGQEGNIYFPNLPNPMQMRLCEGPNPTQRQVHIIQINYDTVYPLPPTHAKDGIPKH